MLTAFIDNEGGSTATQYLMANPRFGCGFLEAPERMHPYQNCHAPSQVSNSPLLPISAPDNPRAVLTATK